MKTKKKILVYNHIFFLISETFVYQQARDLTENYEVHVLSREFINPHGVDYSIFNKHQIHRPKSLISRAIGKLIRLMYNTSLEVNFFSFVRIQRLFRKHHFNAIHAHFGPNALDILGYARAFNIPLVVTFHGHDASRLLNNKKYKERLPELFDYASGIIIVSRHMIETLELEPWIDKVHVIPCSVDPEKFIPTVKNKSSDKIKIVHSGRVVPTKGVPDLIKVFCKLADRFNNLELHIAGDGSQLDEAKELARDLGYMEKVFFHGRVSHNQVKKLLDEADIFVLNSRKDDTGDMEGTPVTILEAMCLGKPVVSTIHAGIPDVIEHGKNGLLVHEYANEELETCLELLIERPELRKKLGDEAKNTVRHSYTNQVTQRKMQGLFESFSNGKQIKVPQL